MALTNAVFIASLLRRPAGGVWLRVQHHAFDAAGVLGVGLAAAAVIGLGTAIVERASYSARRRRLLRTIALAAYAVVTAFIMIELVGYELDRIALSKFGGRYHQLLFALGAVVLGSLVPAAHLVGWWSAGRPRLRIVALLVALSVMVANHFFLRDDYAGVHGALAWLSATLAGMAAFPLAEMAFQAIRPRVRKFVIGVAVGIAVTGIVVPPPVSARIELFREPGALSAWVFARTTWPMPGDSAAALPPEVAASPFFQARDAVSPVKPTKPALLEKKAPVVVFITIDATRADAIDREKNEEHFPTIAKLKKDSAYFARATSAGSQTAVSLSAMFSGRHFSQLVWKKHGEGPLQFVYPASDPSPRFPEILSKHHVTTASFCSITFLTNEYGVARGFTEETVVVKGREHARAEQVMTPLLERLQRAGDEPLFLYAHLMEPHSPYDRGGKKGSAGQRYLAEIGIADEYIGKLVKLLDERFSDRAFLIISSDHGEAFGEHGTIKHTKTLYEELLRVPLIVRGPGVVPRRIEQRVTLVDLGPTILDIFGIETPGTYLGQSLVPLLAGRDVHFDRPILAEGRLRRVLYWGDLKVIDDPRRKVVEVFDLERDPRELHNLFDKDRARSMPGLAALRAFFEAHRVRIAGYDPPYKP